MCVKLVRDACPALKRDLIGRWTRSNGFVGARGAGRVLRVVWTKILRSLGGARARRGARVRWGIFQRSGI